MDIKMFFIDAGIFFSRVWRVVTEIIGAVSGLFYRFFWLIKKLMPFISMGAMLFLYQESIYEECSLVNTFKCIGVIFGNGAGSIALFIFSMTAAPAALTLLAAHILSTVDLIVEPLQNLSIKAEDKVREKISHKKQVELGREYGTVGEMNRREMERFKGTSNYCVNEPRE